MRLYGDHQDVTLIVQLRSHRYPSRRPNPAAPPNSQNKKPNPNLCAALSAACPRSRMQNTIEPPGANRE